MADHFAGVAFGGEDLVPDPGFATLGDVLQTLNKN